MIKSISWSHLASQLIIGGASGLIATLPMTLAMDLQHRVLPLQQRHSTPPRKITMRIAKKAGISIPFFNRKTRTFATLASHFAYGASAGALYPLLTEKIPAHDFYKGTGYGLMVWGGSYLGWLPAAGIWRPKREANPRLAMMINAHIVWGAFVGILTPRVKQLIQNRGRKRSFF